MPSGPGAVGQTSNAPNVQNNTFEHSEPFEDLKRLNVYFKKKIENEGSKNAELAELATKFNKKLEEVEEKVRTQPTTIGILATTRERQVFSDQRSSGRRNAATYKLQRGMYSSFD